MAIAAIIAMDISSAEEILAIPLLYMMRQIARYNSGIPDIMTLIHAGSMMGLIPLIDIKRLTIRNTPLTIVIGMPERKSFSFFIVFSLCTVFQSIQYNMFYNAYYVHCE